MDQPPKITCETPGSSAPVVPRRNGVDARGGHADSTNDIVARAGYYAASMANSIMNILALVLYLTAAGLLWRRLARGETTAGAGRTTTLVLVAAAIALHGAVLYSTLWLDQGLNFALTGAFSLVAWVVALLYLVVSLSRPIGMLGVVILPLAAITVLIEWLWPGEMLLPESSRLQAVHIAISILAYSLLCLAAVQSLLVLAQEYRLRRKQGIGFLRALPPMQTTEHLMFQMIGLGFFLLTLTVLSGIFFSEQLFGKPLRFTHHIVLSVIAWGVYGVLLIGRWRLGWRGRTAVRWTLGGFALLVLAYFGSKFVLEVILHR